MTQQNLTSAIGAIAGTPPTVSTLTTAAATTLAAAAAATQAMTSTSLTAAQKDTVRDTVVSFLPKAASVQGAVASAIAATELGLVSSSASDVNIAVQAVTAALTTIGTGTGTANNAATALLNPPNPLLAGVTNLEGVIIAMSSAPSTTTSTDSLSSSILTTAVARVAAVAAAATQVMASTSLTPTQQGAVRDSVLNALTTNPTANVQGLNASAIAVESSNSSGVANPNTFDDVNTVVQSLFTATPPPSSAAGVANTLLTATATTTTSLSNILVGVTPQNLTSAITAIAGTPLTVSTLATAAAKVLATAAAAREAMTSNSPPGTPNLASNQKNSVVVSALKLLNPSANIQGVIFSAIAATELGLLPTQTSDVNKVVQEVCKGLTTPIIQMTTGNTYLYLNNASTSTIPLIPSLANSPSLTKEFVDTTMGTTTLNFRNLTATTARVVAAKVKVYDDATAMPLLQPLSSVDQTIVKNFVTSISLRIHIVSLMDTSIPIDVPAAITWAESIVKDIVTAGVLSSTSNIKTQLENHALSKLAPTTISLIPLHAVQDFYSNTSSHNLLYSTQSAKIGQADVIDAITKILGTTTKTVGSLCTAVARVLITCALADTINLTPTALTPPAYQTARGDALKTALVFEIATNFPLSSPLTSPIANTIETDINNIVAYLNTSNITSLGATITIYTYTFQSYWMAFKHNSSIQLILQNLGIQTYSPYVTAQVTAQVGPQPTPKSIAKAVANIRAAVEYATNAANTASLVPTTVVNQLLQDLSTTIYPTIPTKSAIDVIITGLSTPVYAKVDQGFGHLYSWYRYSGGPTAGLQKMLRSEMNWKPYSTINPSKPWLNLDLDANADKTHVEIHNAGTTKVDIKFTLAYETTDPNEYDDTETRKGYGGFVWYKQDFNAQTNYIGNFTVEFLTANYAPIVGIINSDSAFHPNTYTPIPPINNNGNHPNYRNKTYYFKHMIRSYNDIKLDTPPDPWGGQLWVFPAQQKSATYDTNKVFATNGGQTYKIYMVFESNTVKYYVEKLGNLPVKYPSHIYSANINRNPNHNLYIGMIHRKMKDVNGTWENKWLGGFKVLPDWKWNGTKYVK